MRLGTIGGDSLLQILVVSILQFSKINPLIPERVGEAVVSAFPVATRVFHQIEAFLASLNRVGSG